MYKIGLMIGMFAVLIFGQDLEELFTRDSIDGCIVVSSLDGSKEFVYNASRCSTQYLPASTFKIPNTLIGLASGVVDSLNEEFQWDGQDKGWSEWNKNQTLETALPLSCIWVYQEIAQRVGNEKYLRWLDTLDYGNKQTGDVDTTFWLNGDIKISAYEQIDFLRRFYNREIPVGDSVCQQVLDLMIVDSTDNYTIRAKTGWALRITPQHGWYVGIVEAGENVWLFATNIAINNSSDKSYRQSISMDALRLLEIIPTEEQN